jgi:hypothetical protein
MTCKGMLRTTILTRIPTGVLERKIFKNFHCVFTISLLFPLGEELYPMKKLESPPPKYTVSLKLAQSFWRRR